MLDFRKFVTEYVNGIEAIKHSAPLAMVYLSVSCDLEHQEMHDLLAKNSVTPNENGSYTIPKEISVNASRIIKKIDRHNHILKHFPQSMLITAISQFENFCGEIYRQVLLGRDLSFIGPEKQIPLKELLKFSSIEDAKTSLIDKEVASLLREKTFDQIKSLGAKIDIDLIKATKNIGDVVEISERRNCFVHAKGIIGELYISKCSEAGKEIPATKKGSELECDMRYLSQACDTLLVFGVKLASLVWLKINKAERESIEAAFNEIGYGLITNKNYGSSISLFEFALYGKEGPKSEEHKLRYTMNLAQSYKWNGDDSKCKEVLGRVDWKTKAIVFRLCKEVLSENYPTAIQLLKMAKDVDDINIDQLKTWPIFQKFVYTDEFKTKMESIFGVTYDKFIEIMVDGTYQRDVNAEKASHEIEKITESPQPNGTKSRFRHMIEEYMKSKAEDAFSGKVRPPPEINKKE